MGSILKALLNLSQRTGRFTAVEATGLYNKLWLMLGVAPIACFGAFLMNALFGWKESSLALAIVFAVVTIYMWAKPLHITVVAGIAAAEGMANHANLVREAEKALEGYFRLLRMILLAGVTFLFIVGTISFRGNPGAILPILVGLGVVGLFNWAWPKVFVGTLGCRLVYGYAVVVIAMSFVSLSGPSLVKYTHFDPASIEPSRTEEALYRLNHTRQKVADEDRAEELDHIADKIRGHKALTQAEIRFVADQSSPDAVPRRSAETRLGFPIVRNADKATWILESVSWPKVTIPKDGQSESVAVPPGMSTVCVGNNYLTHVVHTDGSACVLQKGECAGDSKPQKGVYLTNRNEPAQDNTVRCALVAG